jgi:hypothetical protein
LPNGQKNWTKKLEHRGDSGILMASITPRSPWQASRRPQLSDSSEDKNVYENDQ